jgi:putative ABC transport system substrate-binding protein
MNARRLGRRDIRLFGLVLPLLLAPFAVDAQTPKVPRVGVLVPSSASVNPHFVDGFRQGLRDLGHVEGRSIVVEPRFAEGRVERFSGLAAELVRLEVDVIVVGGPMVRSTMSATSMIAIVMVGAPNPVADGLVASVARPGANVTGTSGLAEDLPGKSLQLLKETVPGARRVCVLGDPTDPAAAAQFGGARGAADALGIDVQPLEVRNVEEVTRAFEAAANHRCDALFVATGSITLTHRQRIADLATRHRLPAIQYVREFVAVGGLMAYGPSFSDMWRRAATYVDKILEGAKPADLPVEQPTKFDLVVNLKTAAALGIRIPQSILLRADEVIE